MECYNLYSIQYSQSKVYPHFSKYIHLLFIENIYQNPDYCQSHAFPLDLIFIFKNILTIQAQIYKLIICQFFKKKSFQYKIINHYSVYFRLLLVKSN